MDLDNSHLALPLPLPLPLPETDAPEQQTRECLIAISDLSPDAATAASASPETPTAKDHGFVGFFTKNLTVKEEVFQGKDEFIEQLISISYPDVSPEGSYVVLCK